MIVIKDGQFLVKKQSQWGTLVFKEIDRETAKKIIVNNHYSHKWNSAFGKVNIGVFKDLNEDICLGVASFGNMMNPRSFKSISEDLNIDNIIELNRLWVDDCLGKNTETILLSACWTIIRNKYPNIKVVQSFADGRLGCGTIYKAASFKYYGYSESLFYENIKTKEVQHKVPMENTLRPQGMIRLNAEYCSGILKAFKVKTYRYIFLLDKRINIKLKEKPYPAYDKGLIYIDDYEHNKNLIARAYVLSLIYGKNEYAEILNNYILDNWSNNELDTLITLAINNKSIQTLAKKENFALNKKEIICKKGK